MTDKASIQVGDTKLDVPVVIGTEDERAIDVAQLRAKTGYVTIDPAFMNTASTKSAITFIDGDKGILRYRGIPIEQLAEKPSKKCFMSSWRSEWRVSLWLQSLYSVSFGRWP